MYNNLGYIHLKEVFSKAQVKSLLPHGPYNCAIELLPRTSPPKGRLLSLLGHWRKAIEEWRQLVCIADMYSSLPQPLPHPLPQLGKVFSLWRRTNHYALITRDITTSKEMISVSTCLICLRASPGSPGFHEI